MKLLKRILKWSAAVILLALTGWLFIAYWLSTNDCDRNAATPTTPMKAILNCEYGVENLQLRDIEKPTPRENELLVHVRAASVNPVDGHTIRGGWLMRPMSGMRKPKNIRFHICSNHTQAFPGLLYLLFMTSVARHHHHHGASSTRRVVF